jgi:hypothetical protein
VILSADLEHESKLAETRLADLLGTLSLQYRHPEFTMTVTTWQLGAVRTDVNNDMFSVIMPSFEAPELTPAHKANVTRVRRVGTVPR